LIYFEKFDANCSIETEDIWKYKIIWLLKKAYNSLIIEPKQTELVGIPDKELKKSSFVNRWMK
jgi:hypothetical protein